MVDWPSWVAMVMLFAQVICGIIALRLASRLYAFEFQLSLLSLRGEMLPVPSVMLDGRKMSKHGASRRSAASIAPSIDDRDDALPADILPSTKYDPSEQDIDKHIKEMLGTEDMPKCTFITKNGSRIRLATDGRKCRLCPRRDDSWDPVWLAVFRRDQQFHHRQHQ